MDVSIGQWVLYCSVHKPVAPAAENCAVLYLTSVLLINLIIIILLVQKFTIVDLTIDLSCCTKVYNNMQHCFGDISNSTIVCKSQCEYDRMQWLITVVLAFIVQ